MEAHHHHPILREDPPREEQSSDLAVQVLVELARDQAGRKHSVLSSEDVGAASSHFSASNPPALRQGGESAGGFTESGFESLEQLRPFAERAAVTQLSLFPKVAAPQEQTWVGISARRTAQSKLLDSMLPDLRADGSTARLSRAMEKFALRKPNLDTVRLWQQQHELKQQQVARERRNQLRRQQAFSSKLKAKFKNLVVRRNGGLVGYSARRAPSIAEELEEFTDAPLPDPMHQTVTCVSPVLKEKSPARGLYATTQSFWGGGHPSSSRKKLPSSRSPSPTFGGSTLLKDTAIPGTFRERVSPNPHLPVEGTSSQLAVGLQGRRVS